MCSLTVERRRSIIDWLKKDGVHDDDSSGFVFDRSADGTEKHIRRVDGDDEKFREEIRGGADVSLLGLEVMRIGRFLIINCRLC